MLILCFNYAVFVHEIPSSMLRHTTRLLYFIQLFRDGSLLHKYDAQAHCLLHPRNMLYRWKISLLLAVFRRRVSGGLHMKVSEVSRTHGASDNPPRCLASHTSGYSRCTAVHRYTAAPWPCRSNMSSSAYTMFRDRRCRIASHSVLLISEHLRERWTVSCLHLYILTRALDRNV